MEPEQHKHAFLFTFVPTESCVWCQRHCIVIILVSISNSFLDSWRPGSPPALLQWSLQAPPSLMGTEGPSTRKCSTSCISFTFFLPKASSHQCFYPSPFLLRFMVPLPHSTVTSTRGGAVCFSPSPLRLICFLLLGLEVSLLLLLPNSETDIGREDSFIQV